MGAGLDNTSPGLVASLLELDRAENAPILSKEDWEESKFYDPEIQWDESFRHPKLDC